MKLSLSLGSTSLQKTLLPSLGSLFSHFPHIFRIVDENKDGVLNFEEFLGLYDFLDFLKNLFKTADKDNSGKLDRKVLNLNTYSNLVRK